MEEVKHGYNAQTTAWVLPQMNEFRSQCQPFSRGDGLLDIL